MKRRVTWGVLVLMTVSCGTGCSTPPAPMDIEMVRDAVRIHSPETGEPVEWASFVERAERADVVVLGELHDDHVAHLVQRALLEDLVDRSSDVTLALEMLERDEQLILDDYCEGLIDKDTFTRETGSASWAGEGSWDRWYQPIIDVVNDGGGRVIAANAPRRYVRIARTEGWDRLEALPDDRRRLVEWPDPPLDGGYKQRFIDLMGDHAGELDDEFVESYFRAQTTWDATMAGTVSSSHVDGGTTVLLVGQFHSNLDGGTVEMLRRYMPGASLLVVTLRRDQEDPPDDPPPADLVVDTSTEAR
jgi:uncharacterized iron-regulated protein